MKKIIFIFCLSIFYITGYTQVYPKTPNTIRVMSYNIRNALGMDTLTDYERIADIIAETAPDVVALQELDSVTGRSKGADVLSRLANLTAMHSVYGASIPYGGGKYGIGVLSNEKPQSWKRIPLPGREEARSLLLVEFKDYIFCCSHFSLNEDDRIASVDIIDRAVKDFDKPVILAGDLNALPKSSVITSLKEKWSLLSDTALFTIPSNHPNRTIDYILGYIPKGFTYSVWQTRVLNEPVASDHLPLFADIRLKTAKADIFRSPVYLQNPATDGMTVMWLTNVPCCSWVEYGTDSLNMQRMQTWIEGEAMANNTLNRIRLTGLKPGTHYYYRVYSREITLYQPYKKEFGETAVSPVTGFTTPDDRKTDFTAVIFNDLHNTYPLFDKLLQQLNGIPYDLVIFNGDCLADVQTEDIAVKTISHYSRGIGADKVPAIYIRGNHETRGAYSPFIWNLLGMTDGHSYGAFNIGDTRFVLLDCGEDKPDDTPVYYGLNDFTRLRKDQAEFLKKEIKSKAFKSASKRVLIHHIPVYGMPVEAYVPCRDEWGNILAKAPFDICLNGHTHRFQYIPKGLEKNVFPVVIGGGNNEQSATVSVLRKQGKQMTLTVLNAKGEELLLLNL